MVKYRRNFVPGGTFFLTGTLADRTSTLLVDHVAVLRHAFAFVRQAKPFTIDAIVILPEHLHMIVTTPDGDADFPDWVRRMKARFTQGIRWAGFDAPQRGANSFAVWQPRFREHTVRDFRDYANHVDYIHYNPVKHGHVANPTDWPYSSLLRFITEGVLPKDWNGDSALDDTKCGEPT